MHYLVRVKIPGQDHKDPGQLSCGQQQRAALRPSWSNPLGTGGFSRALYRNSAQVLRRTPGFTGEICSEPDRNGIRTHQIHSHFKGFHVLDQILNRLRDIKLVHLQGSSFMDDLAS